MARNRETEATTKRSAKRTGTGTETATGTAMGTATGTATATTGHRNTQIGTVVKAKMQKTVVVAVERLVQHDVYRKTIKRTSTFMAHDDKGAKEGDRVRIVETRPLSRNKRWRVEEILTRGLAGDVAGVRA
jgi:small subunit ribosomal protein S17